MAEDIKFPGSGVTAEFDHWTGKIRAALTSPKFFIAGTERSGTTWLQLLMDAHPAIACRGEGHLIDHLFPKLDEALEGYGTAVRRFNKSYFKDTAGFPLLDDTHAVFIKRLLVGLLFSAYDAAPGTALYGEKTPANIRSLDVLSQMFPQARYVFIIRDGRDVAVSLWHHGKPGKSDEEREPLADLARRLAKSWRRDIERAQAYAQAHPGQSTIVRYEDLHATPEDALAGLFGFFGVDNSVEVVKGCMAEADFKKYSGGRPRGEEDKDSQFRKGIVGDWRNFTETGVGEVFEEVAGDHLRDMGYA